MAGYEPIKVAYRVFNPANGVDESLSPVIFLHGMTGSKEMWDDIPQKVADRTKRKAYAIDARNHGDSVHTESFNFDMNIDDLLHFMDIMDIKKAVLVGQSMGGLTATNTALRKPDRVDAVFSEDMFTKKIPQEILNPIIGFFKGFTQVIENIPSELNEEEALKFAVDLMMSKIPKEHEHLVRKEQMYQLKNYLQRGSDGKYDVRFNKNAILQAILNSETLMSEPNGQFDGPAFFLYGTLSPMQVDKEEDNIRKLFPKAELIEFKDATHNVHGDFPEKYVDTVVHRMLQLN